MRNLFEKINTDDLEKLVMLAKQIVDGDLKDNLKIARSSNEIYYLLRTYLTQDELLENFSIFLAMEDDFDDHGIPLREDVRKRWGQDALKKLDVELNEIIQFYKKDILEGCKAIINMYAEARS